eukprot:11866372-Ditylum_brightwellii.AAC.1
MPHTILNSSAIVSAELATNKSLVNFTRLIPTPYLHSRTLILMDMAHCHVPSQKLCNFSMILAIIPDEVLLRQQKYVFNVIEPSLANASCAPQTPATTAVPIMTPSTTLQSLLQKAVLTQTKQVTDVWSTGWLHQLKKCVTLQNKCNNMAADFGFPSAIITLATLSMALQLLKISVCCKMSFTPLEQTPPL